MTGLMQMANEPKLDLTKLLAFYKALLIFNEHDWIHVPTYCLLNLRNEVAENIANDALSTIIGILINGTRAQHDAVCDALADYKKNPSPYSDAHNQDIIFHILFMFNQMFDELAKNGKDVIEYKDRLLRITHGLYAALRLEE